MTSLTRCGGGQSPRGAWLLLCAMWAGVSVAAQRSEDEARRVADIFFSHRPTIAKAQPKGDTPPATAALLWETPTVRVYAPPQGRGFVVVATDDALPTILGYSDTGTFASSQLPPPVAYWLACYGEAEAIPTSGSLAQNLEKQSVMSEVEPLLRGVRWGQDAPYNNLCPQRGRERCVTGCVATAMAQVMSLHQYPENGRGRVDYYTSTLRLHLSGDLAQSHYSWSQMLDGYSRTYTSEEADAVAQLMYDCGLAVRMDYNTSAQGGSGAYQSDLVTAYVDHFAYDPDAAFMMRSLCTTEDWHRLLMGELDNGRPVNYGGQSYSDGGHSFVLDGYRWHDGDRYPYYHVNWGWDGDCDGYYQIADLSPQEGGRPATTDGFNQSQQMTLGIQPDDGEPQDDVWLATSALRLSQSAPLAGDEVQVYCSTLANMAYRPFDGQVGVVLVSADDSLTLRPDGEVRLHLSYLQEQRNMSLSFRLPADVPSGGYRVALEARRVGSTERYRVFSPSADRLTIGDGSAPSPDVLTPKVVALASSELEPTRGADISRIVVNIYEVQNMADDPFIGDLRMIFADGAGRPLVVFGDTLQPDELSRYYVLSDPLRIGGTLGGEWPDGHYRLYVGARYINATDYVPLTFMSQSAPERNGEELFLDATIEQGALSIGKHKYSVGPTGIMSVSSRADEGRPYDLSGVPRRKETPARKEIIVEGKRKVLRHSFR